VPSVELIQGIIGGGVATVLAVGLWWLATGRGRVGTLVDKEKQELKDERDGWKALAQGTTPELKRLNDLLDTAVKLLLDPSRRPPSS